jgi:Ras-related protein Rab-1A
MKKKKPQLNNPEDYKIILLGETNAGKTTLYNKFIYNKDKFNYLSSITVDNETQTLDYKNKKYLITLYDTAGQERFRSITKSYYKMADGFLLMFDITDEKSLLAVKDWIEDIKYHNSSNIFLILGNKDDLDNKISDDVINETLGDYKHLLLKTSAIKDINVKESLEKMIDMIEDENNLEKLNENKIRECSSFHIKNKNYTNNNNNNQSDYNKSRCC